VSLRQKQKQIPGAAGEAAGGATTPTAESAVTASATGAPTEKKKTLPEDKDLLTNPIRVTKAMAGLVRFKPVERYVPASGDGQHIGVVVLRDTMPGEAQDVVKVVVPPAGDVDPNEPAPPEPFEWTPPSE